MTLAERKVLHAAQTRAALKWKGAKRERRRVDALMRARRRAERISSVECTIECWARPVSSEQQWNNV